MEEDLQAMLGSIGQKFDMSFDQSDSPLFPQSFQNASNNPEIAYNNQETQTHGKNQENITLRDEKDQPKQGQAEDNDEQDGQSYKNESLSQIIQKEDGISNKALGNVFSQNKFASEIGQTLGHFQNQQEQLEYYRSLNIKFQLALNKIANKSVSFSRIGQEKFIERLQHYEKQRSTQLTLLRREKQERETVKLKFKPLINSKSVQMLNNYKPIEYRYNAVLKDKMKKIEKQKAQKLQKCEEERLKQQRYVQIFHEKLRQKYGQKRSQQEYYDDQQKWLQNKYKHVEDLKRMKEEKIQQEITFQPQINKRSDNMMKKKKDRVVIYEKQPQIKPKPKDIHCTFKPNLTKSIKI